MKILWIYNQHHQSLEYDHWLHMDFASYFNQINGLEIKAYGENLNLYDFALNWSPNKNLSDIYQEYKFDVIIVNTKGRCFKYYDPIKRIYGKHWLPPDFGTWNKKPKIMIEEDFQYEKELDWYVNMGFDWVLQRHYNNYLKAKEMKSVKKLKHEWFPFSINKKIFFDNKNYNRINKICFVGNYEHEIYSDRKKAIDTLDKMNMIINYGANKLFNDYIVTLGSYNSSLCGITTYELTPAKVFEIMASGSLLFINDTENTGLNKLFKDSYVVWNDKNIISQANIVLNNKDYRNYIVNNALKQIEDNHTHESRIKQLHYDLCCNLGG